MNRKVHVIDDDPVILCALDLLLKSEGFETVTHSFAVQFLSKKSSETPLCIVTDIDMPDMTGLELAAEMSKQGLDCPVIILTGHGNSEKKLEAYELGAAAFLLKPVDPATLLGELRKASACVQK